MKTLKDYDLQRGDWVKFGARWSEFHEFSEAKLVAFFYDDVGRDINTPVRAVLRPSVIIRDELNRFLGYAESYLGGTANEMMGFMIIHPKEEKSAAELIQAIYDDTGQSSWDAVKVLAAEIDKLREGKK